jgi:lysophospholipase L1-like esterase
MIGRLRWKTEVALAVGVTLAAFVVLASVAEVASRYRERHRTTVPGTMPMLFYRHVRLRHALVRNLDYFGWIHVNGQGFRGPEVVVKKAPRALRIMAVGSSTTFDPGVGDQATWPARLQLWLNRRVGDRPVEVINAGVPGYFVIDDVIRLETELFQYKPDVIVLYEGHNDLFSALRRGRETPGPVTDTPSEVQPVTPWGHWLSRHSLLYGKLVERVKALRFGATGRRALANAQTAGLSDDEIIEWGARQFERDLSTFLSVARTLGIRVVIPEMVQASGVGAVAEQDSGLVREWRQAVPFASPPTVLRGYLRYNAELRAVAERFGATYVPTGLFGLAGSEWYQAGDPIHFNDRGAERMAQRLAEALAASPALHLDRVDAGPIPPSSLPQR